MENDVIVMILTTISTSVLTIAAVIIGNISVKKNQQKNIKIQTITMQRINWLEVVRKEIAEYLMNLRTLTLIKHIENPAQFISEREWQSIDEISKLSVSIMLRLNPGEDVDLLSEIEKVRNDVLFKKDYTFQNVDINSNRIIELAQKTLKREWEKVKAEAITYNIKYLIPDEKLT